MWSNYSCNKLAIEPNYIQITCMIQYIRAGRRWIWRMQLSRPILLLWFWLPTATATRFWSYCSIEVQRYQCLMTSGISNVYSLAWCYSVAFSWHLFAFFNLNSRIWRLPGRSSKFWAVFWKFFGIYWNLHRTLRMNCWILNNLFVMVLESLRNSLMADVHVVQCLRSAYSSLLNWIKMNEYELKSRFWCPVRMFNICCAFPRLISSSFSTL